MKQSELAAALGIDPGLVSRLKRRGMPVHSVEAAQQWRRENVVPRAGSAPPPAAAQEVGFDLARERALLMRTQRREVALRVAVAEREFAPVQMLAAILAAVSATTAERLDALAVEMRRACPGLPAEAFEPVDRTVRALRTEWAAAAAAAATQAAQTFNAYPEELTDDDELDTPDA